MVADSLESLCQQARKAIETRNWAQAKLAYLQALALRSDVPDVHYGLATVYFQQNELTSAAHHFREVGRLDPKRAGAFVNLGAVLNLLTEFDEAIAALRKGIALDPKRTEGYYNLGLVYRRKGQVDLAVQAYREAIRLNPRLPDAHLNLANLYFEKQQYRPALNAYEAALEVRPGWAKALDGVARAKAALSGEYPGAAEAQQRRAVVENQERLVDPAIHGDFLHELHQAAVEAEEIGRYFQAVLHNDMDAAVKDLSLSLLQPNNARISLEDCVLLFEEALQHVLSARESLELNFARLRVLDGEFASLPTSQPTQTAG